VGSSHAGDSHDVRLLSPNDLALRFHRRGSARTALAHRVALSAGVAKIALDAAVSGPKARAGWCTRTATRQPQESRPAKRLVRW